MKKFLYIAFVVVFSFVFNASTVKFNLSGATESMTDEEIYFNTFNQSFDNFVKIAPKIKAPTKNSLTALETSFTYIDEYAGAYYDEFGQLNLCITELNASQKIITSEVETESIILHKKHFS